MVGLIHKVALLWPNALLGYVAFYCLIFHLSVFFIWAVNCDIDDDKVFCNNYLQIELKDQKQHYVVHFGQAILKDIYLHVYSFLPIS